MILPETDLTPEEQREIMDRRVCELAEIDSKFGLEGNYDRSRIEGEIRIFDQQYKQAVFETGKRLILLKEHEGHGGFLNCLERLDIARRTASHMMAITRKYIDETGSPKWATIAHLPPSKLYALASMDDSDLEELEKTGEVKGLTKEETETLSAKKLKERVLELSNKTRDLEKKLYEQSEINEQILADKNKKIDAMDRELRSLTESSKWSDRAEGLQRSLNSILPRHTEVTSEFAKIIYEIETIKVKDWEQSQFVIIEQCKDLVEIMSADIDRLSQQVSFLVSDPNKVFHSLKTPSLTLKVARDAE